MNINKLIEQSNNLKQIRSEIDKITKQAELDLNLKEAKKNYWNNISEFKELFEDEIFTEYTVIAEWQYEIDDYLEKVNYVDLCEFQFDIYDDEYYILNFEKCIHVYQDIYNYDDSTYIETRLYIINKSEFDALDLI